MKRKRYQVGFALPTVLITSIIMMIVLLSALTVASSVQSSLRQNYYDRIARNAAESGAVYAEKCLLSGSYAEDTTITPSKNCNGGNTSNTQYVVSSDNARSTFSFKIRAGGDDKTKLVAIVGSAEVTGRLGGARSRTVKSELKQRFSLEQDKDEVRATKRYWYFGEGAVFDFRKEGTSRTIKSPSGTLALEGSTTVSDKSGDLLFWSNGQSIYNLRSDGSTATMRDGGGLRGETSATQAVAAFPLDGEYNKIGVVSNNAKNEDSEGELYYSIVDMTKEGGKGQVVSKNVRLGSYAYAQEGIGAMPSNRPGKFWVYGYRWTGNQMKVTRFLVGASGQIGSPVTQTLTSGAIGVRPACDSPFMGYGTFNFSDDYKTMVLNAGQYRCTNNNSGQVYLMDTNADTGALSVKASWTTSSDERGAGYSADFSPDEKFVYVTNIYPGKLMRYRIDGLSSNVTTNSSKIRDTRWVAPGYLSLAPSYSAGSTYSPTHESGGQILRGPDGRMYIADQAYLLGRRYGGYPASRNCYISVINKPNSVNPSEIDLRVSGSPGSVEFTNGACVAFGLPQMATVFEPKVVLY